MYDAIVAAGGYLEERQLTNEDFLAGLTRILPPNRLMTAPADRAPYEGDWRGLYRSPALAIAMPQSTAEVQAIVTACAAAGVAIVPQGGNTGLVGGAVPMPGLERPQIVLSLRRMDAIRALDRTSGAITVEAGAILDIARAAAAGQGLELAISLAAQGSCTIGGVISTNAGGVHVLSHGMTREHVMGLEAVLPDGSLHSQLGALHKNNVGLDLKQLFIGSEGTLGIVTAATLRLRPRPRGHLTALVALSGPAAAVEVFTRFRDAFGSALTTFEYVGALGLSLARAHCAAGRELFAKPTPAFVLVEVSELGEIRLDNTVESLLAELLDSDAITDCLIATTSRQRDDFWALRENVSEGERMAGGAIKHDIAVSVSVIPEAVRRIEAALEQYPMVRANIFGHIGDGNLHVNLMSASGHDLDEIKKNEATLSGMVYDIVGDLGGTFSAEHGIGILRVPVLARRLPAGDLALMRAIKTLIDPQNLMNPGKVLA